MATSAITSPLAPGARVQVRDEEWIVRSVRPEAKGVDAVHVTGVSELVRGRQSIFLTDLDDVQVLRPEDTQLVQDDSATYRRTRLYLESLLRRTPPTDSRIHLGHEAAIDVVDYQLEPAAQALSQLRPRILMADGVGLGKTIEVGILLTELMRRGRGRRILVVAMKSILEQFQEELWARFTIPLVRLDSVGIQRVQSRIPSNMNPFHYYDRVIVSIDTLKNAGKYRQYLEQCHWDCIVVDECQHVAMRTRTKGGQGSQRAALGDLLARTCDSLVLTSATPHDGSAKSFASLIRLLEPTAIANEEKFTKEEVEHLFLRRFKKDVAHQLREVFPEREDETHRVDASPEEDAFLSAIHDANFETITRKGKGGGVLFRTTLLKAFLSSPAACIETIDERLRHKHLQADELEGDAKLRAQTDQTTLLDLKDLAEAVGADAFGKAKKLVALLKSKGVKTKVASDRVVVFSERIATLRYLEERLKAELKLKDKQVAVFHGSLTDQDQMSLVKSFGTEDSPIRVLLASDAAAEGINLHFYSHRLIQFDLPWSLITMVQRNGRIDRFGQRNTPHVHYLLTVPSAEGVRGDLQVLDRLIEKEAQVAKNLGDAASLMNVHKQAERQEISLEAAEEIQVARVIQGDADAEEVLPDEPAAPDEEEYDWYAAILGDGAGQAVAGLDIAPAPSMSLFASDLAFAKEALAEAVDDSSSFVKWEDHLDGLSLAIPPDLEQRYAYLPQELLRDRSRLQLTIDRDRVKEAHEQAREGEGGWPEWELLWPQHPVMEWLDDSVLAAFGRHEAPVLRMARGLEPGTQVFLFQGVYSNRLSQPLIVRWFGIPFRGAKAGEPIELEALVDDLGLASSPANPSGGLDDDSRGALEGLRIPATEAARSYMSEQRLLRAESLSATLKQSLSELSAWKASREQVHQLEMYTKTADGKTVRNQARVRRAEQRIEDTRKLVAKREEWIKMGLKTTEEPYLRLVAVFVAATR